MITALEPILYAGSVKNVRAFGGIESEELLFEFTDRYSVFDWGVMPQTLDRKGEALGLIGSVLFERLASELGLQNHYRGLLSQEGKRVHSWRELKSPPRGMIVQKIDIFLPDLREVDGKTEYVYVQPEVPTGRPRFIPLEVVFRHRLTVGSSILERRPDLKPGDQFAEPLIEFFTKHEPRDRHLDWDEALRVSGLSPDRLEALATLNRKIATSLRKWFSDEGLELIDGKFEWAETPDGEFMLVDSIGPDELRIETQNGIEISKEVFRRFYRCTEWFSEVQDMKSRMDENGETVVDWQAHVKRKPPLVPYRIIEAFSGSLQALANQLTRREFFETAPLSVHADAMKLGPDRLKSGKILLIGNGGREHALAWKILQSNEVRELYWYPPHPAAVRELTREFGKSIREIQDGSQVPEIAEREGVELIVIGPDQYLADGWTDLLEKKGLRVFGPTQAAARLEWSKGFCKDVLRSSGVPTAESFLVTDREMLSARLNRLDWSRRWVIKADGLALGKGVKVCSTLAEAEEFGSTWLGAKQSVMIEEFLVGRELSWFAFCDGETVRLLEPARDYKTLFEGGQGPNTGGMGAITPVPGLDLGRWSEKIRDRVFQPVIEEMKKRGTPYRGLLYAGLMIRGERFWVLEFNARFGDPETQALLPRMTDDLVPWLVASADGRLSEMPLRVGFHADVSAYVVLASRGYPESPEKGVPVSIDPERVARLFFGGTMLDGDGLKTSGGRVMGVLGQGATLQEARARAYAGVEAVEFSGMQYRRDIGHEPRPRLVVLASGRGSNFEAICRELGASTEISALIVSRRDAGAVEIAKKRGIPAELITENAELLSRLQELRPDLIVLAGYMKVLPQAIIEAFRDSHGRSRIVNVHPSLLPDLKGMNSYRRAFEEGRSHTGVTVHAVEPEVDAGPVLAQEAFSIAHCRSAEEVEQEGLRVEHRVFPKAIQDWIALHWDELGNERRSEPC